MKYIVYDDMVYEGEIPPDYWEKVLAWHEKIEAKLHEPDQDQETAS